MIEIKIIYWSGFYNLTHSNRFGRWFGSDNRCGSNRRNTLRCVMDWWRKPDSFNRGTKANTDFVALYIPLGSVDTTEIPSEWVVPQCLRCSRCSHCTGVNMISTTEPCSFLPTKRRLSLLLRWTPERIRRHLSFKSADSIARCSRDMSGLIIYGSYLFWKGYWWRQKSWWTWLELVLGESYLGKISLILNWSRLYWAIKAWKGPLPHYSDQIQSELL